MFIKNKFLKIALGIFLFFLCTFILFDGVFGFSGLIATKTTELGPNLFSAFFIFVLLTLDAFIPVPSSVLMVASGALFGWIHGSVIALSGLLAGALVNFMFSRYLGYKYVIKSISALEYEKFNRMVKNRGSLIIIVSRFIPMVAETVSTIAGLSKITLKRFMLLNLAGFIPVSLFYSYSGAAFKGHIVNIFLILTLGFVVPLLYWLATVKLHMLKQD